MTSHAWEDATPNSGSFGLVGAGTGRHVGQDVAGAGQSLRGTMDGSLRQDVELKPAELKSCSNR
jgi:hypothetical protein